MIIAELYADHETELQRYALRLAREADWAADLVQETFIRALRHQTLLQLLQPPQRRAWLYRTLKNLFIDEQIARRRRESLLQRLGQEQARLAEVSEVQVTPNPFEQLTGEERALFEKRYVEGFNSQEIAAELGVPAATVRSRLHLAMKKLRLQQVKFR